MLLVAGCSTATPKQVLDVSPPAAPTKYAALVVDAGTGRTLFQSNATAPRYPASLTKMMTMYMVFEALDSGRLSKSTLIPVSANAASEPPTRLGLRAGGPIDVDTALRALAVKSANDAATAIGEYLGGSEQGFAAMMTAKARQLGMRDTRFANASGLPDPAQQTTARDMAVLGLALRSRFSHHYHYFAERQFSYRGRLVRGHNDMLGRVEGVDGIKTGYIRASGYNIVTSVRAGGRSLVIVVMGADSARARNAHVEELIERYLPGASGSGFGMPGLFSRN
jgi:D-alanyl-D-alanine carboxypeptidase